MNTREIAEEYRLSHWSGVMRERQESGLSIKKFCQEIGCHENVYYYWQRKLREAAVERTQLAYDADNRLVPSGWARLEAVEASAAESGGLTIEVGGCRINATAETDPELLAQVCRMLKAL